MHYWQRYLCFTMTCVTPYLCLDTFLLLIFPNITLFIYSLFYGSSVHHGYSKLWCLSKHLGFLLYPWIWCCHGCGVWKKTCGVTRVTPYSQPPPQFMQAGQLKLNYQLPARYWAFAATWGRWAAKCSIIMPFNRPQSTVDCHKFLWLVVRIPLPLIPTLLFPKRTFTELEELILCLFCHHLHPLFMEMNQSKFLWTGRTLAHPQSQMLRSIVL